MIVQLRNRRLGKLLTGLLLIGLHFLDGAYASGADWPQWRFDANRSASTKASGPRDPGLLWSRALGAPDPAYDHQYRMCADATYAPIAAEGLLFLPSNADDCVAAFDLNTGSVRWRFMTEGPVRFAPAYEDGAILFGADDGRLYCLTAREEPNGGGFAARPSPCPTAACSRTVDSRRGGPSAAGR